MHNSNNIVFEFRAITVDVASFSSHEVRAVDDDLFWPQGCMRLVFFLMAAKVFDFLQYVAECIQTFCSLSVKWDS